MICYDCARGVHCGDPMCTCQHRETDVIDATNAPQFVPFIDSQTWDKAINEIPKDTSSDRELGETDSKEG